MTKFVFNKKTGMMGLAPKEEDTLRQVTMRFLPENVTGYIEEAFRTNGINMASFNVIKRKLRRTETDSVYEFMRWLVTNVRRANRTLPDYKSENYPELYQLFLKQR